MSALPYRQFDECYYWCACFPTHWLGCFEAVAKHLPDLVKYRQDFAQLTQSAADREIQWVFGAAQQLHNEPAAGSAADLEMSFLAANSLLENGDIVLCISSMPKVKKHQTRTAAQMHQIAGALGSHHARRRPRKPLLKKLDVCKWKKRVWTSNSENRVLLRFFRCLTLKAEESASLETSDVSEEDVVTNATSEVESDSAESDIKLHEGSESEGPPQAKAKASRCYKARLATKRPSIRLAVVLPNCHVCVCLRSALFFFGASWLQAKLLAHAFTFGAHHDVRVQCQCCKAFARPGRSIALEKSSLPWLF